MKAEITMSADPSRYRFFATIPKSIVLATIFITRRVALERVLYNHSKEFQKTNARMQLGTGFFVRGECRLKGVVIA